jgi:hypothetical protein
MLIFKKFKEIQSFVSPKKFIHHSKFIKNENKEEVKKIKEELQKYEKRPEE